MGYSKDLSRPDVKERLALLLQAVGDARSVLILPHNDPDPDAIASAVALRYLLEQLLGVQGRIAYKGIIGRAENKALVRFLDSSLQRPRALRLRQETTIALVDTQPGAGNNPLPPHAAAPAIVIDHHPWREATAEASFADVRVELGSTSTILTEYFQAAAIEPTTQLATALFYGVKTDTMGLVRGATPADVAAYFYLQSHIDVEALINIERAQVPAEYFQRLHAVLQSARVYDEVVISYVGVMSRPDMAAEMADLLLRLRGTQWVVCTGAYEDDLILAVRSRSRQGGAGQLAQDIVGDQGSAGGHGTMAGGQIPLRDVAPEQLAQQLAQRALSRLKVAPGTEGKALI